MVYNNVFRESHRKSFFFLLISLERAKLRKKSRYHSVFFLRVVFLKRKMYSELFRGIVERGGSGLRCVAFQAIFAKAIMKFFSKEGGTFFGKMIPGAKTRCIMTAKKGFSTFRAAYGSHFFSSCNILYRVLLPMSNFCATMAILWSYFSIKYFTMRLEYSFRVRSVPKKLSEFCLGPKDISSA